MLEAYQQHMRKYVTEALGTFFLVFTIGCCTMFGASTAIAAAVILAAFVYAGAPLSGGHYNPAVSLGVWMRGQLSTLSVVPYMLAQSIGAVIAAVLVRFLIAQNEIILELLQRKLEFPSPFLSHHMLLVEFLFTFALVFVVLQVATSPASRGNSYFGVAIGFTLLAGILAVGPVSGAALNPAVALSLPIMGLTAWSNLWVYFVANFAGGAAAAWMYDYLNPQA